MRVLLFLLLFFVLVSIELHSWILAQDPEPQSAVPCDPDSELQRMLQAEEWVQLIDVLFRLDPRTVDQDYLLGLSLSRLEQLVEAERVFQSGMERAPNDPRFPLAIAGIEFKRGQLSEAERLLHAARKLGADADYVNEFLGTIYYLRDNLHAALKYWNRVGRPEISSLRFVPAPSIDTVLFDRFFTFARNEVLTLEQLSATQKRIEASRVFSRSRFQLDPLDETRFELTFLSTPRTGINHGRKAALFSIAKELPFQTVRFDIFNPWKRASTWENSYRFQSTRQRLLSRFAKRLESAPQWGYWFSLDLRSEVWELNPSFSRNDFGPFDFEKVGGSTGFEYLGSDDWRVVSDFHLEWREFKGFSGPTGGRFTDGALLRLAADIRHSFWRRPEEDLELGTYLRGGLGSVRADDYGVFPWIEGGLFFSSYLDRSNHDWRVVANLRAGRIGEGAPFDQLFVLGIDQDTDLWLRGHSVIANGRKGNSPLGNQFFLLSTGIVRPLWESGLLALEIGPFVDSGWIEDTAGQFAPGEWLVDLGVQLNVRLLGDLVVQLSYGRDLKDGSDAFRALPPSRPFP